MNANEKMKASIVIGLIFACVFSFFGLVLLYSGVESCEFCPFQSEISPILQSLNLFTIGLLLFAPFLILFQLNSPPHVLYAVGGFLYVLLISALSSFIYFRYNRDLKSPFSVYAAILALVLIILAGLALLTTPVSLFGWIFPFLLFIVILGATASFFLSGVLLFVTNDLFHLSWEKSPLWKRAAILLLVTFCEYGIFRLALRIFLPQLD